MTARTAQLHTLLTMLDAADEKRVALVADGANPTERTTGHNIAEAHAFTALVRASALAELATLEETP